MKKHHLLPLSLFCIVFLAYALYFVKVVSVNTVVEKNSISKEIRRSLQHDSLDEIISKMTYLDVPQTRYVNYAWLNLRTKPSSSSTIVERIKQNDEVKVLGYPTSSWAYVEINGDVKGYVSRRYLSAKPITSIRTANTPRTKTPPAAVIKSVPEEVPEKAPEKASEYPTGNLIPPDIYDVPIITYHHITDEVGKYPLNLTLPNINFTTQLDYLVQYGFETLTFHDLKAVSEGKRAAGKSVILTFDDGYDNHYTAAQHLNGKGLKGVFFIITDRIGTDGYLDWRQVKKMRSWGMEIASHGVTSADLSSATAFYVADELERSKKTIEEQLGEDIVSFAYPAGKYNGSATAAAKEAGYSFARTIEAGSRYKEDQFFALPTLRVFPPAGAKQFRVWLGE